MTALAVMLVLVSAQKTERCVTLLLLALIRNALSMIA
jgi:hypothetical protein